MDENFMKIKVLRSNVFGNTTYKLCDE